MAPAIKRTVNKVRPKFNFRRARRWPIIAIGLVAAVAIIVGLTALFLRPGSEPSVSPISRVETQDYHALALAPGNPDTVFFGHHGGILESLDGGKTWNKISGLSQDAMNLAVSHENPEVMYLAGHNVFMKSGDGGQTWRDIQNNLPGLDLHWFAPDPDNSSRLYANAAGFGLHQSSDGGVTWTPWDLQIPGDASVSALTVLGGRPVNVLAGTEDGNLFLSSDGAASWEQVGTVNSMPMAFALNPDGVTIYLGSMDGVYRSEDKGLSWTRLPLETRVMALAAGGLNPERVVVVNDKGEVFRSDDGGQTW